MQCEHMIWKHTGSRTLDWSACFWLQKKTKTLSSFHFRLKCLKLHDAYPCISMHIRHILSLTVTIRGELPSPPGPDPVRRGVTRWLCVTYHAFSIIVFSECLYMPFLFLVGSFCSVLLGATMPTMPAETLDGDLDALPHYGCDWRDVDL